MKDKFSLNWSVPCMSYKEADEILDELYSIASVCGYATVSQLCTLLDVSHDESHDNIGWNKHMLRSANIELCPDVNSVCSLKLPKPEPIFVATEPGLTIAEVEKIVAVKDHILDQAKSIINGERQGTYGHAENSFTTIANLWSAYLRTDITASDVANMMILMKVARNSSGVYKEDNWIDICGYAALGGEIQSMEDNKEKEND